MNRTPLIVAIVLLLLALVGALVWGFSQRGQVKTITVQQQATNTELSEMTLLRDQLAGQVEELSAQYENVASDNEELQGQLSTAQQELRRIQKAYDRAINTNANDKAAAYEMRKQIEDLIMVRSDLERSIRVVSAQNDSLRSLTTVLRNELGASQEETRQLTEVTQQMTSEIQDLTLKNFKASAFQVDLLRRNGEKLTAKAGQVRKIAVSFDLTGVPEQYQGVRPLHLVITDQAGTPLTNTDVIPVKATVNGQATNISPVQTKEVNVEESQRLTLVFEPEDKLKSGFYRAQVYTDIGLLGASQFRLR